MTTIIIAMDKASVRSRDANGFLHVEVSNISKANVCPYYGREIPVEGLDPEKIYYLYRDADELAKAAETFNNVPLLSQHVAVIPDNLPEDLIIGSTGTDAEFDGTYLRNSLVIWSADYQDAIENGKQKDLSCGYRYRADMTPGVTKDGLRYDGVMREIIGNHVALVIEGRAGPDVQVGDEQMKLKSRTALMVSGAAHALVRPLLAADAKIDIAAALDGVTGASFARKGAPAKVARKIAAIAEPHVAADKALDIDALIAALSAIPSIKLDEDMIEEQTDQDDMEGEDDDLEKDDEKDIKQAENQGKDNDPAAIKDDDPKGMDAASVRRLIADAERRGAARIAAIDTAKRDVAPLVGEIVGMDSAEAVYAFALDTAGFDKAALDKAPLATLKAMVAREVELRSARSQRMAVDAVAAKRANDSFEELYGSN